MATKAGGHSDTKIATEEIQKYCQQVKTQVEGKTKKTYTQFKAVKFRQQVVAGMNYLVKIHVCQEEYIHVKMFRSLPGNGEALVVNGVKEHHKKDDPLLPF